MAMPSPTIHTLANGMRAVCAPSDGRVSYIGVLVRAGSRNDGIRPGLAHFVEHTVFKGTGTRRRWHIANRMEAVGGELNAYTTREETMFYTSAPAGYEGRALDLLADLLENASFPESEIELERGVVCEEINSYRDNASDAVYDEFDELIYAGSPMAHNILGTAESVARISRSDARGYVERNFAPEAMVCYCMGPTPPDKCLRLIEKHFGRFSRPFVREAQAAPEVNAPFDAERERDNSQANTLLGCRTFPAVDPRRYPLLLLNNLLGGPAINSRFNQELRERRGLVYSVDSSVVLNSDCGVWNVYYACERNAVEKCRRIITREIGKMADKKMTDTVFARVRNQYCGQLLCSGDNREHTAMAMAKSLMVHGEVHGNDYVTARIREVTPEQVRREAEALLESPLSRLTLT